MAAGDRWARFFLRGKAKHEIEPLAHGVPGYRLTNTCEEGRYRITKTIVTDPKRDVLLQKIKFEALKGELSDYTLYALLCGMAGAFGFETDKYDIFDRGRGTSPSPGSARSG